MGIIVNGDEIQGIIDKKLKNILSVENYTNNEKLIIRKDDDNTFIIEKELNEKIEIFLEKIIETYINSWYSSDYDNDTAFLAEIRHHCCYAGRRVLSIIKRTDFEGIIIEEVLPQILLHFQRIKYSDSNSSTIKINVLEEYFKDDVHYGLRGNININWYMNMLSEKILRKIIDVKRVSGKVGDNNSSGIGGWPSKSGLHLLEDLMVNFIFNPLIEYLSEPDNLNKLFLQVIDSINESSNEIYIKDDKTIENVVFLKGLEDQILTTVQDSLLQVKLGTIIKDPRLLQTFEIFLEDFNGPLALLQILRSLDGTHKALMKIPKIDDSEMILREIEFDLHQIYATWKVFKVANEREIIKLNTSFLNEEMFKRLKNDLDDKNILAIDKIIEEAYRNVYEVISKHFVVPFSQSECYFGYLCGSSPVDVDQFQFSMNNLIPETGVGNVKIPESLLTFSSFRNRVWSVMIPSGSVGNGEDEYDEDCYEMSPSVETPADNAEYNNLGTLTTLKSSTKLSIRIEDIEIRRDSIASRSYYVYAIAVISTDISTAEPTSVEWTVLRRPEEFYVLQQKLLEKRGSALASFQSLPPKKSIASRDKIILLENLPVFENFLNDINHHSLLQKSDLFFNFLSSPDEFKDSINFSELNPWRVVKKVPQKLSREKGQNLKSFILNSLANLLAPPSSSIYGYYGRSHSNFDTFSFNDNLSTSSICESEAIKYGKSNTTTNKLKLQTNTMVLNKNENISCIDKCLSLISKNDKSKKPDFYTTLLIFILNIINLPRWILYPFLFIEYLFTNIISNYLTTILRFKIKSILIPSTFSSIISALHGTIFDINDQIITAEEKNLRKQLAKRKFIDLFSSFIPLQSYFHMDLHKLTISLENLFNATQMKESNKQLVMIIIDKIIQNVFDK
uniref:PXA domain-containing protein n=1 Tax=Parastrongyloides trichosuri TaxID=131310 RepID=A0A0N4ZZ89_PARTI